MRIAIDGEGYSIVSEWRGHCLSIFDPQGNKLDPHMYSKGTSLDPSDGSGYVANYGDKNVFILCRFSMA